MCLPWPGASEDSRNCPGSVCIMSRKHWLFVEKTCQPHVWNRGVLVFSTNDSSATAPGAETAGTGMQPLRHLLIHKTQIFHMLQCLQALIYCSSCGTSSRVSFLCCPKVWQRSCVMQREFLSRYCWHTVQYLLTLCHIYVGEKGPWDPEGKKQSSLLVLFSTLGILIHFRDCFWNSLHKEKVIQICSCPTRVIWCVWDIFEHHKISNAKRIPEKTSVFMFSWREHNAYKVYYTVVFL